MEDIIVNTTENVDSPLKVNNTDQRDSIQSNDHHHSIMNKNIDEEIDVEWENLYITATVPSKEKINGKLQVIKKEMVLLNNISGYVKHGMFTAIMGPSGSGKTTLLNFLSSRIDSSNIKARGDIKVNTQPVNNLDHIRQLVAYVTQDDILFPTMTPREAFMFVANLRLKLSTEEKHQKVEILLQELGLTACANTYIGNTLIRGISGGEKKRTAIGVELMMNPSIIFLDEPTTGLDSSTALLVLDLLKQLAKTGRTVVSTIHQPSSDIYNQFDDLMLLTGGNIIYQGSAKYALDYFARLGFLCPKFSNPADYFMKIMNEKGFAQDAMLEKDGDFGFYDETNSGEHKKKFEEAVQLFVRTHNQTKDNRNNKDISTKLINAKEGFEVGWFTQFYYIYQRAFKEYFRNPMELRVKLVQLTFFAIICIGVYSNLGECLSGIQNRYGLLFFLSCSSCFNSLQGSLTQFSGERPLFIKERLANTYRTSSYFWAKSFSEAPFLIILPTILISIVYFVVGLNTTSISHYLILVAIHVLTWFAGSGFGLLLSTLIPKLEVALVVTPALIVPFIIFAGYIVNQSKIPVYYDFIVYIDIVKFNYQASVINEFTDLNINCPPTIHIDPIGDQNFQESLPICLVFLGSITVITRILGYIFLSLLSKAKRIEITKSNIPSDISSAETYTKKLET